VGHIPSPRTRTAAALALVVALLVALAACSGSSADNNDNALPDDGAGPTLVTSTPYVPNSVRVNYHTDVIVFMDPTSGSQELQGVEAIVATLPAQSAILVTSDQAYQEARCLFAGQQNVMDTLVQDLVPNQFRLDFGGNQAEINAAAATLEHLPGVAGVTGGPDSGLAGVPATGLPGGSPLGPAATGARASTTTSAGPTSAANQTRCQAQGIRIK
jgi:hypothetical protein